MQTRPRGLTLALCLVATGCSDRGAGSSVDGSSSASSTGDNGDCQNGIKDPGEACDDGNEIDGDGCNRDCIVSGTELWRVETSPYNHLSLTTDSAGSVYVAGEASYLSEPDTDFFALDASDGRIRWQHDYAGPSSFDDWAPSSALGWRTGVGVVFAGTGVASNATIYRLAP